MSFFEDLQLWWTCKKPFEIIEQHFGAVEAFDGEFWYVGEGKLANHAQEFSRLFRQPDLSKEEGVECLKIKNKRKIFRVRMGDGSVVVKGFFFDGSLGKQWYRHCFYALDEAINLIIARERLLPVPDVLAYGEKRSLGRRLFNVAVIENIENAVHPTDVFRGEVETSLSSDEALHRVAPMFERVYYAGCNHIDLHGTSFLLSELSADLDKIIDFQFAVFHPEPSLTIFCHQLAHFIRASRKNLDEDVLYDWAEDVLKLIVPPDLGKAMEEVIKKSTQPVPSGYDRMMLKP